jgi:hypothetical protein
LFNHFIVLIDQHLCFETHVLDIASISVLCSHKSLSSSGTTFFRRAVLSECHHMRNIWLKGRDVAFIVVTSRRGWKPESRILFVFFSVLFDIQFDVKDNHKFQSLKEDIFLMLVEKLNINLSYIWVDH